MVVALLSQLRKAILNSDEEERERIIKLLNDTRIDVYLRNYMNFNPDLNNCDEYIYVLSRREEKDILKIGMTTKNVVKRCQEINSATGVIYPFSPRKVYRVTDAKKAERLVHDALSEYRIRADREFFNIEYKEAIKIIEDILKKHELHTTRT